MGEGSQDTQRYAVTWAVGDAGGSRKAQRSAVAWVVGDAGRSRKPMAQWSREACYGKQDHHQPFMGVTTTRRQRWDQQASWSVWFERGAPSGQYSWQIVPAIADER